MNFSHRTDDMYVMRASGRCSVVEGDEAERGVTPGRAAPCGHMGRGATHLAGLDVLLRRCGDGGRVPAGLRGPLLVKRGLAWSSCRYRLGGIRGSAPREGAALVPLVRAGEGRGRLTGG